VRVTIERYANALASTGNVTIKDQGGTTIATMANLPGSVDCFWTGTTWIALAKTANVT
jgi:hypothetical protein